NGLPTIVGTGSVIIDDTTGAIIAQFPQIWGCDEMWYNEGDDHYVYPCANNVPPQAFFVDAGSFSRGNPDSTDLFPTFDQSVFTATGLSRAAADPVSNQVYLPVTNAAAPQAARLCSPFGLPDNLGCILVITPTGAPSDIPTEGPTTPGSPGSRGRCGAP